MIQMLMFGSLENDLHAQDKQTEIFKGDYLGKRPPGIIAEEFDSGRITGDMKSFNFSFSPDGDELFFSYNKSTEENPHAGYEIKNMKRTDNIWSAPETAFFSGKHSDVDITFSPDGTKLFFASERSNNDTTDIYYLEKTEKGWSEPKIVEGEVNSDDGDEIHPCLSNKGNLFYRSTKPGGFGGNDLYKAEYVDGKFINERNLGPNINTEHMETDCFIAHDESFILFNTRRPEDDNKFMIYISFQLEEDKWSKAVPLGEEVASIYGAMGSTLSPDGKYLFFSSRRGDTRAKYWISTEIFEKYRPEELKKKRISNPK